MVISTDSIVRVIGKPGSWRVVQTGLTLGSHLPTVRLEDVAHPAEHTTELLSTVYTLPAIRLD